MLDKLRLQELQNLLESYDMINMVRSPTRITFSTKSLIDVIKTNKDNPELKASVVGLGFSDHLAQIVRINIGKGNRGTKIVVRRRLTNIGIEEFKNLLSNESWNEIFNQSNVNSSLKVSLDFFLYCFDVASPYKRPANITPCMNSSAQVHLRHKPVRCSTTNLPTVSSPYSCISTRH